MQAAATPPPVTLDGYVRGFKWWSGEPYWVQGDVEYGVHPNNYRRMFHIGGAWFWALDNGTPILDEVGNFVWDTMNCF